MEEEAETSRYWNLKYPPFARESQCIEIKDNNLSHWQQSIHYKGDSNQLEVVSYKIENN